MYYFHTDQVGLPEELSNAQGQLVWQAQYRTWGSTVEERWEARRLHGAKVQAQTQGDIPQEDRQEQNLRFQGQYLDRETGLHYNTFRYYDADIGRFISPDPIGLEGGINLGSYSPNPISWIDPWEWNCSTATKPIQFKRWKPGNAIDKPLADGRNPTWDVVRSRYWKNRAAAAPKGEFSRSNMERMKRGSAPLDKNGNSMELHHHNPQRNGGANVNNPYNLREVTREQHAALDAYRHLGK